MRVNDFSQKIKTSFKTASTGLKNILVFAPAAALLAAMILFPGAEETQNIEANSPSGEFTPEKQFVPEPVARGRSMVYFKPEKTAFTGTPFSFNVFADDADGDTLVYSASGLPDGASFDPVAGALSWTPRYNQAGDYTVHFEVSDGELTDAQDITISVIQLYPDWDVNGDSAANVLDIVMIGQRWGDAGLPGWRIEDTNEDGTISVLDIIIIGQNWTG